MELNAERIKAELKEWFENFDGKVLNFYTLGSAISLINTQEQKIEDLTKANEVLRGVIGILESDVAERDKMLERKVEEVYPEFMRDYKQMREELTELQKEGELDES